MSKAKTPVQVYMDSRDRDTLDRLAKRLGLSRAETLREAVRRWAAQLAGADDPLLGLIGSLDEPTVPTDLSTRHDAYAASGYPPNRLVAERGEEDEA